MQVGREEDNFRKNSVSKPHHTHHPVGKTNKVQDPNIPNC